MLICAHSLGLTEKQFTQFAADGKLSWADFANALIRTSDEAAAKAPALAHSFEASANRMSDAWHKFASVADRELGITAALIKAQDSMTQFLTSEGLTKWMKDTAENSKALATQFGDMFAKLKQAAEDNNFLNINYLLKLWRGEIDLAGNSLDALKGKSSAAFGGIVADLKQLSETQSQTIASGGAESSAVLESITAASKRFAFDCAHGGCKLRCSGWSYR